MCVSVCRFRALNPCSGPHDLTQQVISVINSIPSTAISPISHENNVSVLFQTICKFATLPLTLYNFLNIETLCVRRTIFFAQLNQFWDSVRRRPGKPDLAVVTLFIAGELDWMVFKGLFNTKYSMILRVKLVAHLVPWLHNEHQWNLLQAQAVLCKMLYWSDIILKKKKSFHPPSQNRMLSL